MRVKLNGNIIENCGGDGIKVQVKNIQLEMSDNISKGNKGHGMNLQLGNESEAILTNNQNINNSKKGINIEEYNENWHLVEQFIYSNLEQATTEDSEKLTELLELVNNEEKIEVKKSYISEIYDIVKNGLIISSMSAGVEKAFEELSKLV